MSQFEGKTIDDQIKDELDKWIKEFDGNTPGTLVNFDVFALHTFTHSFVEFLHNKGIIDREEFILYFKQMFLKEMQDYRPQVAESRRAMIRQSIAAPSMAIPKNRHPKR